MRAPILSDLFDMFFPHCCAACARTLKEPGILCGTCDRALARRMSSDRLVHFEGLAVVAPYEYAYPASALIPLAKSSQSPELLDLFPPAMTEALEEIGLRDFPEVIVPVPLHMTRRRERGFDQAVYLARSVSRALEIPLVTRAIRRRRATPPQKQATLDDRLRSLEDCFTTGKTSSKLAGRRVLLIDDVVTTGATLKATAQAVERTSPAGIMALVAARTPRSRPRRSEEREGEGSVAKAALTSTGDQSN